MPSEIASNDPQESEVPRAATEGSDVWTAEDVAKYLKCTSRHVYNLARRGEIPGRQFGSIWRFRKEQIILLMQ